MFEISGFRVLLGLSEPESGVFLDLDLAALCCCPNGNRKQYLQLPLFTVRLHKGADAHMFLQHRVSMWM